MNPLLAQLTGGNRRSLGGSESVAEQIAREPGRFSQLWAGLQYADPLVRMRAADALEKVSRAQPGLLLPFKTELLRLLADSREADVLWHLAQMTPRLLLTPSERSEALTLLKCLLGEKSSILRTLAMQAIADLSADDADLRAEAIVLIKRLLPGGTAAMKARGRKLLKQLATTP